MLFGVPAARKGDPVVCPIHGPSVIDTGSPTVLIDDIPAARRCDKAACGCAIDYTVIPSIMLNGEPVVVVDNESGSAVIAGSDSVFCGELFQVFAAAAASGQANMPPIQARPAPAPVPTLRQRDAARRPRAEPLEEEEEEEEFDTDASQTITLRIGIFFDGTGNNLSNTESTRGCLPGDVGLSVEEAASILELCKTLGFDGEGGVPDSSYGNDKSNIARLYELYVDESDAAIEREAETASIRVYMEGIGTRSGEADDRWGQASGQGESGVLGRVLQSPQRILESLQQFLFRNSDVVIENIEFDIFGFSRGAAAARHFSNRLDALLSPWLKGFPAIPTGGRTPLSINFIGLFDTVAATVDFPSGDFSPSNRHNPGLDLILKPGVAKKIVQLVAQDEQRLNFPLISAGEADIVVPGAHSDVGGGYRPSQREKLWVSKPVSSVSEFEPEPMSIPSLQHAFRERQRLSGTYRHYQLNLQVKRWALEQNSYTRGDHQRSQSNFAAVQSEREVHNGLSLIYLRIMRESAVELGVPFKPVPEQDPALLVPKELRAISLKLHAHALRAKPLNLTRAELKTLYSRYVHLSANWNAVNGWDRSDLPVLFINRPAENGERVVYPNE